MVANILSSSKSSWDIQQNYDIHILISSSKNVLVHIFGFVGFFQKDQIQTHNLSSMLHCYTENFAIRSHYKINISFFVKF